MKTSFDSIACAAIRQPSSSRCGTRAITSRSLKAPGSDSSALTTRYFGFGLLRSTSDALRPIGKPAPPRPRRFAFCSSAISSSEDIASAFGTCSYPPIARYSASFVRSCSSVPASSIVLSPTELLHDLGDVVRFHVLAVAVVDGDDGRVAAAAEALGRAQGDLAVLGRLAGRDAQLRLERVDHLLRADERAGEVGADLDRVPPDGGKVEHVVEGRDRLAVPGRQAERGADLLERLGRQPAAVRLLGDPQRRQNRRARFRELLPQLANLRRQFRAHRSTSPMSVSSEPTIAIRSATSASDMQVAVASSATKLGARNLTRQGFGPPSETT